MTSEENRILTQYYYNSVVEFLYFIILYLEAHKTASLDVLCKHVKFFKTEVADLISSFEGKNLEDKLHQILNTLDCFVIVNNEVKLNKNVSLKYVCFGDLILSKCVDLIMKGFNNIDDICTNLNNNNFIFVDKKNLLLILKKYSNISIENDEIVTLYHLHGLLAFEDFMHNSIIGYFHELLSHVKILSVKEIENHRKCLTFCGIHNIIGIFSILICSNQFTCQNGYVWLKKKSIRYPKKKPICMEKLEAKYLSRSLHVGQVVYSIFGSFLYKWTGEIGFLSKNSGYIYCVVDFTNGHQGIFSISFNKATLKVISEVEDMRSYLSMRNVVEFDAQYYNSEKLDRCWKATRVKLLTKSKLEYDENLCMKLNFDLESQRNRCIKCCLNTDNFLQIIPAEYHPGQLYKKSIVDCGLVSLNKSLNKPEKIDCNSNGCITNNQEVINNSFKTVLNGVIPNYAFMYGYIHTLMEDKIMAVVKDEKKIYNILFMKNSVCVLDKSQNVVKGQKIIASIPYVEKLESFPVATLVYVLNECYTNEIEENDALPIEFVDKILHRNTEDTFSNIFCSHCNSLKHLAIDERYRTDLKQKMEIIELLKLIKSQCNISFENKNLLQFLHTISKNLGSLQFILKLSKHLTKCTTQGVKRVRANEDLPVKCFEIEFSSQVVDQLQELCSTVIRKNMSDENNITHLYLNAKSNSSDIQSSLSSLSSFKTCNSTNSSDKGMNSPRCLSDSSLNIYDPIALSCKEVASDEVNEVFEELKIKPLTVPIISCESILPSDSCNEIKSNQQMKRFKSFKNLNHSKCLGLQSIPRLKHAVRKRKAMIPCALKSLCEKCAKCVCDTTALISIVSDSFFFLSTNIDGQNAVLQMPKQNIPNDLQKNMKLNSCCEITIIVGELINLSHVISAKIKI